MMLLATLNLHPESCKELKVETILDLNSLCTAMWLLHFMSSNMTRLKLLSFWGVQPEAS